tara:strand:+ start:350 stop:643 length:294 start_codon:yes stop_codon:yes gene_type:complete
MTINFDEKISFLKNRIEQRLKKLSYELADRAEQEHYTKNPICTPDHQASAAEMVEALDVNALKLLKEITKTHEELFDAELEQEKAKRRMEDWRATSR